MHTKAIQYNKEHKKKVKTTSHLQARGISHSNKGMKFVHDWKHYSDWNAENDKSGVLLLEIISRSNVE